MKQWLVRRGLLATCPVLALGLAFGACSSEPGQQPAASEITPTLQVDEAEEVAATPAAAERFRKLSRQFQRLPAAPKAPVFRAPPGIAPPRADRLAADLLAPEPTAVLKKGDAQRFMRHGLRLRAEVDAQLKRGVTRAATVDLPLKSEGTVRVQPDGSKLGVEFATRGVRAGVDVEVSEGNAMFPSAGPHGSDVVLRVSGDGVEDYLVLKQKPPEALVEYRVNVDEIAGLRLYDNTLEFLDASGDPQVRVKPPRVVDADGVTHEAHLALPDCKYDAQGEVPWGRPVTPAGAQDCTVSVSWDDRKVIYPAVVDPVWASAGSLATARYRNAAIKLSTGLVLTCGGIGDLSIAIASCEQFNPAAAAGAGSWAASTAMGTARENFTLVSLAPASPTNVLAVGGTGLSTSERYNGTSWSASTGDFSGGSFYPQMPAATSDGAYVVLIDFYGTPYRFTTATNAWTAGSPNPAPISTYRYDAQILQIPGQNTILRLGGYYNSTYFNHGERYKPSLDVTPPTSTVAWTNPGNAASMTVPRDYPAAAILDNNRLMVYGGYTGAVSSSTAEIYNASANTWSFATGPLPNSGTASQYNRGVTAAFHPSGKLLTNSDNGAYIYDPAAASAPWAQLNTYNFGFSTLGSQANVVAAGSKVLMVPVQPQGASSGAQTACRLFDFGDKGSQCSTTAECQSGLSCVTDNYDGVAVCCDTSSCTGCNSCRAVNKASGTGDGTCGPRRTDQPMYSDCPYSQSTTCGNYNYVCDGLGACQKWPATTQCGDPSCVDGDTQNNARFCDGAGTCKAQTTSDCGAGYQCSGYQCLTSCYNDVDYCTSNYYCQTNTAPYNTCQPKKNDGASCTANSECKKGYCVDNVCCESACSGTCMGCSNALTGQASGSCKPITSAKTPPGECSDSTAANCGTNGLCDGAGACQKYSSGTVCAAASCASPTSRNVADTCNGTGTCVDNGVQNCAAGYACLSGTCQTSCTDDTQCASSYYCDTVAKQCVPDKSQGQACPRDAACSGNTNCVDGVCCESACTGTCRSCLKNRTGLASDGLCGNILDDTDPENECVIDVAYPNSCKSPGTCDGQGACRVYAKAGTVAVADSCSGSTLTAISCDGAGFKQNLQKSCYPYKCNASGTACRVACTVGTAAQDCDDSSFCQDGVCVGQKPLGSPCTSSSECKGATPGASGFCVDLHTGALEGDPELGAGGAGPDAPDAIDHPGVCCDRACGNPCEACKKSIKGQGSDGTCGFVKDHTDPANDCPVDAENPCGYNGQCNGAGACRKVPLGTACGSTTCVGNSVQGQRCDGEGACIDKDGTTDCAPYVCRDVSGAFQCTNPCAEDDDCQDGYYCVDSACKKKLDNGKACDSSAICGSGFCVDGVCCDVSCNGQCEACDTPGNEGVCTPVQGDPHGSRVKCDHAGEECGGQCDGVNAAACKYAANGTSCGTPTCDNDLAKSSACNGQGECKPNKDTECSPYVCGTDDTCLTRCEQDADCSQGYACDETTQRCLPSAVAATCSEDRLTSVGQNGQSTPCKPFLCVPASGTCAVSCAFTTDCSPEFVCEPSTKTCLPAPGDVTPPDESCACRAAGAAPSRSGYLALVALGAALSGLRRRKRSARSPSPRSIQPSE